MFVFQKIKYCLWYIITPILTIAQLEKPKDDPRRPAETGLRTRLMPSAGGVKLFWESAREHQTESVA